MSRTERGEGAAGHRTPASAPVAAWTEAWFRSVEAAARVAREQLVQALRANTAMTLGMTYAAIGGDSPRERGPTVEPVERIEVGETTERRDDSTPVTDPEFDDFLVIHEHVEGERVLAR